MKKTVASLALAILVFTSASCSKSKLEIMAVTGATPGAVAVDVPGGFSLTVDGLVKRNYAFPAEALRAFPSSWLRTLEVSPEGEFLGSYAYTGIPLYNIMDGVAPEKPKNAAFDRPLDMLVTFTSADGKKAVFSYGELTMVDDSKPVILAYDRREVLPSKDKARENYAHNKHKENLRGLRLVCPRDPNTARYLDNVVKITLSEPTVTATGLPPMKQGHKCVSRVITGHWKGKTFPISTAGIPKKKYENWVRTGHGTGFKGIFTVEGPAFFEVLKKNFPGCTEKNFFLIVSCDGYRVLLSGREVFLQESGRSMVLVERLNGAPPKEGTMLANLKDYFVDRDTWGITDIVVLDGIE